MARIRRVTQLTSATTGVVCDSYDGIVQTVSLTLAAAASASFTVSNKKVRRTSTVLLTPAYGGNSAVAVRLTAVPTDGAFIVNITNVGGVALNAAASIQFKVTHN